MGSLLHSAMQIGLHRSAKKLPVMSVLRAELRKRLWATILEMSLQSALDAAMPPRISLDEFDNEPPSNVNDDEIDESTSELRAYPSNVYTMTSMQLALLDTMPTRLRVLELLNGLYSEITYTDGCPFSELSHHRCMSGMQYILEQQHVIQSDFLS